jgi:hypothetical protein
VEGEEEGAEEGIEAAAAEGESRYINQTPCLERLLFRSLRHGWFVWMQASRRV